MEKFLEEEASFMRSGGSWYMLVPPHMREFIGVEQNANNELITDSKIAIGLGKHGKFIFAYSPKQQKKYQKDKAKEGGE